MLSQPIKASETQVVAFQADQHNVLANQINQWLDKNSNQTIVDIQYQMVITSGGSRYYSALLTVHSQKALST